MKPRYTYRPKSIYPSGKISYRMRFPRLRTRMSCRRKRISFNTGPLAGRSLFMASPSGTLRFTILIKGKTYTGHYDNVGTWIGEESYQIA